jgi:hypothetical protein
MFKMNEMLFALLAGINAVTASPTEAPAMSLANANQYLSNGKTCVCQHWGTIPSHETSYTSTDPVFLANNIVCCPQTSLP